MSISINSAVLILLSITLSIESHKNNVCITWKSYLLQDENCYYEPDIFQQTPQILENHVKKYENHSITTEDGYILLMFRIPNENPKGVILLQHPVTSDGIVWVSQGNESLAFLLANQGYDVWIANDRGTYFSTEHINKSISKKDYWDFSFHEIGLYDLPAEINYIRNKTNNADMVYIGQSMSTTTALIYASLRPEEAKKSIKLFVFMSPISYLKNVRSPMKLLTPLLPIVEGINNAFGFYHIFAYNGLISKIIKLCVYNPLKFICIIPTLIFFGWTPNNFDPALANFALSLNPRAVSWKSLYHFAQEFNEDGKFQMYDYGRTKNRKLYGSNKPREYPVNNISAPIYLMYSTHDSVGTVKDAELLYDSLPQKARIYGKLKVTEINHIDYHYGKNRKEKLFNKIFELLHKVF